MSAVAPAALGPTPHPADATRVLYERHSARIFGFCLSQLGSREEAEDAVQITFLNVQRGLDRGAMPRFELAWLFKIARNVCHDRREATSRRGRMETAEDLESLQDVLADPGRVALSVNELTRALAAIPDRQRRALLLREWQGLSYEEIAAELGVSVAAVETLLFRARRAVAAHLEESGAADRRGAVGSIASLVQWLFKGGAAPLKVAVATATVAATAGLAVLPVAREPGRTHAPLPPSVDTSHMDAGGAVAPRGVTRAHTRRSSSRPAAEAKGSSTAPPTVTSPKAGVLGQSSNAPAAATNANQGSEDATTSPPTATLPSSSLPTVTVPGLTDPPEVSLAPVDVSAVQPPVDPPELPDLPKLP